MLDIENILLGASASKEGDATATEPESVSASAEPSASNGDLFGASSASVAGEGASLEVTPEGAPKQRKPRKPREPKLDPAVAKLLGADGIGTVVTNGLDAVYRAMEATPMSDAEKETMREVVAFYARSKAPNDREAYSPGLLLLATVGISVATRGPTIVAKTAPWWRRMGESVRESVSGWWRRRHAK